MSRYCRHLLTYEKTAEIDADIIFNSYDASFLKVRELVFSSKEEFNQISKNNSTASKDKSVSPWDSPKQPPSDNYIEQLNEEMIDVCDWLNPSESESYTRKHIAYKYTKVIEEFIPNSTVVLIGSCSHEAYLPFSDFNFTINNQFDMEESVLRDISKRLLKLKIASDATTIFNEKVKKALIVDYESGLKLSFTVSNDTAILNGARIQAYFRKYPKLRALYMFMKLFAHQNELPLASAPSFGSYGLFHVCLYVVQSRPNEQSLAALLIALLELIGRDLNHFAAGLALSPAPHCFSKLECGLFSDSDPGALLVEDTFDRAHPLCLPTALAAQFSALCRRALSALRANASRSDFLVGAFVPAPAAVKRH